MKRSEVENRRVTSRTEKCRVAVVTYNLSFRLLMIHLVKRIKNYEREPYPVEDLRQHDNLFKVKLLKRSLTLIITACLCLLEHVRLTYLCTCFTSSHLLSLSKHGYFLTSLYEVVELLWVYGLSNAWRRCFQQTPSQELGATELTWLVGDRKDTVKPLVRTFL
ncbi:uncharacterized protein EV154DRAFT_550724 [Mucor mucedo]|uniref:uncharacterized protein n=1 Tax=Mucor mucedo TaxID=29922 RepID=UPI00221ED669|nr:uncharacterized protein EV154DRAFT_550724 [Mucor mucedo]KAI7892354.1 hypothetical protein EV154DRAFT_550724 [Mucor mucedo]